MTHDLESKILADIPIAKAMAFAIESVSESKALIRMPLAPNVNHIGSFFGGSLFSACALASYTYILARLSQLSVPAVVVIGDAQIRYLKPALNMVEVEASPQEPILIDDLKMSLWVTVQATARCDKQSVATFEGRYFLKV
jgi:thioesterase domain-containing protein